MVNNNRMNTAQPLTPMPEPEHKQAQARNEQQLDLIFKALSDSTRRAQLEQLKQGPASISDLAKPFAMSLPAASKHLKVLERANLVTTTKVGRVHYCELQPGTLTEVEHWLNHYRQFWQIQLDKLAHFVDQESVEKES